MSRAMPSLAAEREQQVPRVGAALATDALWPLDRGFEDTLRARRDPERR
jgi:hypothetical protein